jgi:hypothetical protein
MQIGTLVKMKRGDLGLGVVTEVNERDLSFHQSHAYLVQWAVVNMKRWQQDFELEVVCE